MPVARKKPIHTSSPIIPAPYTKYDVYAMKALQSGTANPEQQQRALAWIINKAAKTYDLSYRPGGQDGDRDTAFASGMQHVGQQIVKLINYDASLLHKIEE